MKKRIITAALAVVLAFNVLAVRPRQLPELSLQLLQ
mgnify:CR=1 FL=1